MRPRLAVLSSLLLVLFAGTRPAGGDTPAAVATLGIDLAARPQEVTDVPGVERRIFRDGRVFIAGQPSADALRRLRELGVTLDVTLRTGEELADREQVPYDEAALARELGLEFVHLPIGGKESPWRGEVLDRLHEALTRHRGPVLLHCTVAWRASWVWAAYLVKYGGLGVDEAMARGRAIGLGDDPLALLLGRPTRLVLGDEGAPPPPAATPAPLRP